MTAGWDWQFVAVTLAALWGAWLLLRPLLSRKAGPKTGACGSCSSSGCTKDSAVSGSGLVSLGGGNRQRSAEPPQALK